MPVHAIVTDIVTIAAGRESGLAGYSELVVMPTEDYPGPTKSHPEKQDTNDPPRPANVDPVKPSLPDQEEPPLQEETDEE
jgi:hypothetical protein